MSTGQIIATLSFSLVAYTYLIYPIALVVWQTRLASSRSPRDTRSAEEIARPLEGLPTVCVIVAAFNEEKHIRARIENLLSMDYPRGRLRVLVGSDGSSDGTARILNAIEDPRVRTWVFPKNRGKASVLNDLVRQADSDVLVFTDANTVFDAVAIKWLVEPFADDNVGCVCGELNFHGIKGNSEERSLWRIEQSLKRAEAAFGGLLGANGAIYAIRRQLYVPLPPDTIIDDFCIAMNVTTQGFRSVYEPRAVAVEEAPSDMRGEFHRRVRIGVGNFQTMIRHPEYASIKRPAVCFAYVSHKVLRWVSPHLAIVGLLAWIASQDDDRMLVWLPLVAAGAAAVAGVALLPTARLVPKPLAVVVMIIVLNAALLLGSFRYFAGSYGGAWRRSAR